MENKEFREKVAELRHFQKCYEKSRLQSTRRRIAALAKEIDAEIADWQKKHGKPEYANGQTREELPSLFQR